MKVGQITEAEDEAPMVVDTLGGRMLHLDTQAQAPPNGQLVFLPEFLATAGVFDVHARISEPEFAGQARRAGHAGAGGAGRASPLCACGGAARRRGGRAGCGCAQWTVCQLLL